jgi:hypothetical protein
MHTLPGIDSLVNAPRTTQVDAVVATLLEGAASPDTRKILMSGEHPLAASAASAAQDAANASVASNDATMDDASMASTPRVKGGGKLQGMPGLQRALARNPIAGPAPQLSGLAQMVGFALGSPEFQRR